MPPYPESVQEHRDLVDGRTVGHALLLARVAEVQQPDRQFVLGEQGGEDRHGPPVPGQPAGMGGEQDDVRGGRGGQHVLVVLLGVAGLLGADGDQRRRAVELGAGARLRGLGGVLERLLGLLAQHAEPPRVREVVVRRPAGQLEELEQRRARYGVGPERLVRPARPDELVDHPSDATRRRRAAIASGTSCDWTPWPAPCATISFACGAYCAADRVHSSGVERSLSPASMSVGTSGSTPAAAGCGTSTGGQLRHCRAKPLPVSVARSYGYGSILLAACSSACSRPFSGAAAEPHGAGVSAHSVLACRPWLRRSASQ